MTIRTNTALRFAGIACVALAILAADVVALAAVILF